ncbi:MAG: MlaA family lipoprotein, partial [Stellaceae bacterium]
MPHGAARRAVTVVVLLAPVLFGCATPPTDPAARAAFEQTNDPLEPMNRKILDANMVFDKLLMRPVAKVYVTILPEAGRDAIHRVLANLKEPVIVINNVLQGRFKGAGISVGRFVINSTAGIGGILDIAKKSGLDEQPADFGETLYVWGFPQGPYLVLPIFGPSNPRDTIGMGVDAYIDPFDYLATKADLDELQISRFVLDGIDRRARVLDVLDDLEKNSLDFYAQLRSLSQQQRAAELRRGKPAPAPESPGFYTDPGNAAPPA